MPLPVRNPELSDQEDVELEALQRQLEDAFATTRPRRGFEDELWLRMQARRPFTARIREAVAGALAGFREAPAVPLGAVAVLLVVVIGTGVLLNSGLGGTHGAYSTAEAPAPGLALADGAYGRLPQPALHPGVVDTGVPNSASNGQQVPLALAPSNLYFGPATLRWTGQLPLATPRALVYRYAEPSAADADQFTASLGARPTNAKAAGFLGTYSGADFTIAVRSSVPQLPLGPTYVLNPSSPASGAGDAQAVATAYLERLSLVPQWPDSVAVRPQGDVSRVLYVRAFDTVSNGQAYVVDWLGERYGIEADVSHGQVVQVTGPMPVSLDSAAYPLITSDEAVRRALTSAPATSQALQPQPTIDLSKVELVYALAISGNQGFYEPAYLFSGTFTYNGQTYTKRVLVPLVIA